MCSLQEHIEREIRAREATAAHQEALGDYYDSGAIGDPPKREEHAPTMGNS